MLYQRIKHVCPCYEECQGKFLNKCVVHVLVKQPVLHTKFSKKIIPRNQHFAYKRKLFKVFTIYGCNSLIGRFQAIKTDVWLTFSFITGDKTEFLSPMMFSNEYITGI